MSPLMNRYTYFTLALAVVLVLIGVFAFDNAASIGQLASNYFAAGDYARGVFAAGQFAAGIFAAGTFAIGIFSIGIFSVGIFSLGLFSVGLWTMGFFAVGYFRRRAMISASATGEATNAMREGEYQET